MNESSVTFGVPSSNHDTENQCNDHIFKLTHDKISTNDEGRHCVKIISLLKSNK